MPGPSKLTVVRALAALSFAIFAGAALGAQGLPPADDPFAPGAFDSQAGIAPASPAPAAANAPATAAATEAPPTQAKTEYLLGGTALVSAQAYLPAALDGYAATSGAVGKVFAKVTVPDHGSLYISYAVDKPFFAGLGGNGSSLAAPSVDLGSASYVLPELHYSFDIGKTLFLRLGKQLLAWGPSRVWSPVDFVNSSKQNFFAPIDLREGKTGLRLHLPLGSYNAFLFADFSSEVDATGVRNPLDATVLAARADASLGGFELGLSGIVGAEVQDRAGFDFSGDLFGTAVYGELAYAPGYSDYDTSYMASLGFSRQLGDLKRWTLSAEGFYQSTGADYSGNPVAMSGLAPLYMGAYYAYASLAASELFSPHLKTSLSALGNLSDLSYSIWLEEDFDFPRAVPFTLALYYYGGGAGKEFTALGGGDSFSILLETRLDF